MQSAESSAIKQIIDLTTIRDNEVLQLSLLKSVASLLNTQSSTLYSWTKDGPILEIEFNGGEFSIEESLAELPVEIATCLGQREKGEVAYCEHCSGSILSIFNLCRSDDYNILICTHTAEPISTLQEQVLAGILQIYNNYQSLLSESQKDKLTGLNNRAVFEDYLQKKVNGLPHHQDRSSAHELWIAIIDVDNFKAINDTYGHLFGDEVLIILANLMQSVLYQRDRLFRIGGEEFVVVAHCDQRNEIEHLLDRLRTTVAQHHFPQVDSVTISIGAYGITQRALLATLLDYADQALYESKKCGRNRITFFDDMLKDGRATLREIDGGSIELF